MDLKAPTSDSAFIERQRRYLVRLRRALLTAAQDSGDEEAGIRRNSTLPQENEDDAQKLAELELDDLLIVRDARRLTVVERALKKLDEGTYGLSDESGKPIPRARLEAVPEAIFTVDEEEARERAGRNQS